MAFLSLPSTPPHSRPRSPCAPIRHPRIVCSTTAGVGAHTAEERKREALERFGLDPADFDSGSTRRSTRRHSRDGDRGRRPERAASVPVEPKPPRTTHKLLKVLSGKAHRKKLLSPKGMDVRPMMELVKGAAFDIIQAAGGCPTSLRPGRWLDLYSGTGSVGIEALSRGCVEAHFVEMDPWVISEVLKPNLEWTGFLDYAVLHMLRVENFLQKAVQMQGIDGPFDYISVTPPYTAVDYNVLMNQLEASPLVGEDTFVLVEYPLRTSLSDSCKGLVKIADRRFGRTHLAVYGPTWAQKKRRSE